MDSRIAGLTDFLTSPETAFSSRHLSGDGWTLWISYKLCPFLIAWQMKPTPDKTEVQEKKARTSIGVNCEFLGGGGAVGSNSKWEKKFCSHLQMKCSCVSFLASTRSKIGKMECVCVTVEEFCLLCDHLLWPKTRLGGNSTFYSVWLNVELIFNIWHFTQIIRPKTWPWGIFADCFFSTSATVELLFLKKAFELDEVITSDGCGHPDLEQLRESDIMIVEPC